MEETTEKKITPFDFIESINNTGEYLLNDETDKQYVPFVVNRGMSFGRDTIMFANEINKYSFLPKNMQYEFLLNIVKKKKRYNKWIKQPRSDYIDEVMEWYQCSFQKACKYVSVLSDDQLQHIKTRLDKGGKRK